MTCPEKDRIIDLVLEHGENLELEVHLRECVDCRATMRLLREIPRALRPEITVPAALDRQVLAALEALEEKSTRAPLRPVHVVSAALLGAVTAVGATAVTGAVAIAGGVGLVSVSLGGGAAAVVFEVVAARRSPAASA